MRASLNIIIKWLKDSGLKVNWSETEICIFHRNLCPLTTVSVDSVLVQTTESINNLGVEFESKLQWSKKKI